MKNKNNTLLICFLLCCVLSLSACSAHDEENTNRIKSFLYHVKKQDMNTDHILNTFMMKKQAPSYIKLQKLCIPSLHEELKAIDLLTLQIIPYNEIAKKYRTLLAEDIDPGNIYVILNKGKVFHFILMDDNRIKSFSTLRFGSEDIDKRVFTF